MDSNRPIDCFISLRSIGVGQTELNRAEVCECLVYYEDHRGEIDLLVTRQMAEAPA